MSLDAVDLLVTNSASPPRDPRHRFEGLFVNTRNCGDVAGERRAYTIGFIQ
ncbi:hypothetical protein E2C01_058802 [Portunus trituberculatus]|uniref:Uncharacterized protein n=1 Tax=Portunus trituberculatus TaxID=210409 RepID=A0A5B7H3Q6_PORTR|nr:hypothetical protein [Portunus trituberculatus]